MDGEIAYGDFRRVLIVSDKRFNSRFAHFLNV